MTRTADAVRTLVRGTGQTLITLGVVVLLFCVYEVYFTNLYTDRQQNRLGTELRQSWALAPAPTPSAQPGRPAPRPSPVGRASGEGLAVLWIPRVGIVGDDAQVVVEGVDRDTLKRGPGHIPQTALPGELGNVVISGHRTTYGAPFHRLDELRDGDAVVLETRDRWFTYRVVRQQVVAPTAVEVTFAVPGMLGARPTKKLLTLTTCNPKYSARTRLIVTAELAGSVAKSAGMPAALTGGS